MRYVDRPAPRRSGFYLWMMTAYLGKDNKYADLAADMSIDHNFPAEDDYKTINDYLEFYCGACSACLAVFRECWIRYARKGN